MQIDSIQTALATLPSITHTPNASAITGEYSPSNAGTRPDAALNNPAANLDGNKTVEDAVDSFNQVAEPLGIALQFSRDDQSGRVIVKLVDQNSGEMLRQIPDEAALRLSVMLGKLQGIIVDRKM